MDDETRREVLGEALMDELRAIRENTDEIPAIKHRLEHVDERLTVAQSDMKVVKAAVRDISSKLVVIDHRLDDHDRAIKRLEHKAA